MQQLYQITVPGLEVSSDWRLIHDRLLDEFSEVTDVLPTTMKAAILIVYEGPADADAWLATISETILNFRRASVRGSRLGGLIALPSRASPSGAMPMLFQWHDRAGLLHLPPCTSSRRRSWRRSGGRARPRSSS
jgi:hypothetical protein